MAKSSIAGDWLKANGHSWNLPKASLKGKQAHASKRRTAREVKSGWNKGQVTPIKAFVEMNRATVTSDCIHVPFSIRDRPARLSYLGKVITAAKYMLLLSQGQPKHDGAVVRHLCGNGHLSCVNPKHLAWGDTSDNVSDQQNHRAAGDNIQDRIHSVTR